MFRGIAIVYRHKVKFLAVGVFLMTFLLGYRFIKLSEVNPSNHHFKKKYGESISNINTVVVNNIPNRNDKNANEEDDYVKKNEAKIKNDLIKNIIYDRNPAKQLNENIKQQINNEINQQQLQQQNIINKINDLPNGGLRQQPPQPPPPPQFIINKINLLDAHNKNEKFKNIDNNLLNQEQQQQQQYPNERIEPGSIINGENITMFELDLKKLDRIVHIDLKGAPPKIEYFKDFIPMLKKFGATGILLEYEDVFPYEGQLAEARHGHAYSLDDVNLIKTLAKDNDLFIIPLVQTYGHLEWLLKVKKFAHLRDAAEYPQVISQCLEESYVVINDMLDQVINQHPDVPYFHIGCDEVYYKLMHPNCSNTTFKNDFTEAFMIHLIRVATHVRKRLPKAKIIIWDDMLHNMDEMSLNKFRNEIQSLEIEPMIWAYVENVRDWFQPYLYIKYGRIFQNVWAASAYKGASGELTTVTSIQHHYLNHISWVEVILDKHRSGTVRFRGTAITGWSRYDHFLALCDLLPESVPSLIFNLQTMLLGKMTTEKRNDISSKLGCSSVIPWSPEEIYDGYIQCKFPGHEIYEAVLPINNLLRNLQNDLEYAKKYLTPINVHYNYVHKARAVECMEKLYSNYYALNKFKNKFVAAGQTIYQNDTIAEWLAVYLTPHLEPLYQLILKTKELLKENDWKPRPLPITIKQYPEII